jgi:hypothetical protein
VTLGGGYGHGFEEDGDSLNWFMHERALVGSQLVGVDDFVREITSV